jgi:hypothetical protein
MFVERGTADSKITRKAFLCRQYYYRGNFSPFGRPVSSTILPMTGYFLKGLVIFNVVIVGWFFNLAS